MNAIIVPSKVNSSIEEGKLYVTRMENQRAVVLCLISEPNLLCFEGVVLYTTEDSGYEDGEVYSDLKKSEWDYFTDTLELKND